MGLGMKLLFLVLLLTGCRDPELKLVTRTACYHGVAYLQTDAGGITVMFDIDGKPLPCGQL